MNKPILIACIALGASLVALSAWSFSHAARRSWGADGARAYVAASERYRDGDLDGALVALRGKRGRKGNGPETAILEGKILYFQKDFKGAKRVLSRVVNRDRGTVADLWYARALVALGENREAEKFLGSCLARDPGDWRLLYQSSVLAAIMGEGERRLDYLNKSTLALEESARAYLDLATIWRSLGEDDRALDNVLRAKAVSDREDPAYAELESFERSLLAMAGVIK
jgi:tetratricopeptide (TPR) repeat protein